MIYKKAKTLVFSKDSFPIALWPSAFVLTFKKVEYINGYVCRISCILIVFRFLRLSAQIKIDVTAIKDFIFNRWI